MTQLVTKAKRPIVSVLGGTGRFGAAYIRSFVDRGCCIRILARSPALVSKRFPTAEVIPGSMMNKQAVMRAMVGADAAFLITPVGGNDDTSIEIEAVLTAIASARATDLPHLIHLSLLQQNQPTGVPVLDVKGEIETLIASSGVPWSSLRTGCYMDAWLNFFPLFMRMGIYLFPVRSGHVYSFTAQEDVAFIAMRLILQNRSLNAPLDIIDPKPRTVQEVAGLYTECVGHRLWPAGRWVLPVISILKPIFFRWYYPEGASRIKLFHYFNNHDWTGDPRQLSNTFPDIKPTTVEEYIRTFAMRINTSSKH